MFRLTVLYKHPKDLAAFDRYHEESHIPLAKKLPGLKGYVAVKPDVLNAKEASPVYVIVELYFEDREAFEEALASTEGQAAVSDVPNFASGGATFLVGDVHVYHPLTLC